MKTLSLTAWPLLLGALIAWPHFAYAKASPSNLDIARQLNQAFVEVAEKVSRCVVVINVVQKPNPAAAEPEEETNSDSDESREFRRFFRKRLREMPTQGQGSGVIIREDGFILTNGHVLEDAVSIEVRLQDGRTFKGEARGIDPQSDVAVLKIDATGLPVATLADSTKTRVGEFAIAIGAPFSLEYSVTFGHVSAKSRSDVVTGFEGASMDQDFIQTDANINPGNSGGPLVNIEGEVIGINTLIRGLHTGIGFAIPSSLAREISDQLISNGKFTRAWLGISIRALRDDSLMRERVKAVQDGVVVSDILPEGPAAKSELRRNDIILNVEGTAVSTPQQLRSQIRGKPIGQPVNLDVFRKDKTIKVAVTPAEWLQSTNNFTFASAKPNAPNDPLSAALGLTVHALTSELAEHYHVQKSDGVIVVAVDSALPAGVKGLKPGDVITSVDQKKIATPKEFRDALKKADAKRGIGISFKRDGSARFETLKEGSE